MHFTVSLTTLKHKKCVIKQYENSSSLQFVPDWFITRKWIDTWHDDYYDDGGHQDDDDDDDEDTFFEWYDGYKKWKAQNASIKEELLPIVWPEEEKKETEKL